jgi:hypothetical protein
MIMRHPEFRAAIRKDAENVPLPGLNTLSARIKTYGRHRLAAVGELLKERPGDPAVAELWLTELFTRSLRQIGATQCLGPTFLRTTEDLDADVLEALPAETRQALVALTTLASDRPIPVLDPRLLAHALVVDGHLVAWLRRAVYGEWREALGVSPEAGLEGARQAYRRLRRIHHPDAGGDATAFHAIQQAWVQAQAELTKEADRSVRSSVRGVGKGAGGPPPSPPQSQRGPVRGSRSADIESLRFV